MTVRWLYIAPLAVFVAVAVFLAIGLTRDAGKVPSPLVGKPMPEFRLPLVADPARELGPADFRGEVYLLNVWATWCVSCRQEHQVLMAASRDPDVRIVGLDYKDDRNSARRWLDELGDPYVTTLFDERGRAGIDLGVYGTPETFVVDADGIIRYKHIGPMSMSDLEDTILPLVRELQESRS